MKTLVRLRFPAWPVVVIGLVFMAGCRNPAMTVERDVVYGEVHGRRLLLDVYRPAAPSDRPRPAVLMVHGGAWRAGDKSECADIAPMLIKEGYVAFAVGYRLATPETNHWPAQLDDVQRAVRWVRAHAACYGVNPDKIGALGGSAGGHIVARMGTTDTRDNSDPELAAYSSRVSCVVAMCGPTDLTEDISLKVAQGEWCNEQIRVLLGGTPAELPEKARDASPLFHVDARTAPTFLVQGRNDDIVPYDHAVRFAEALKKEGVPCEMILHDGGHDLDDWRAMLRFMREVPAFLRRNLGP